MRALKTSELVTISILQQIKIDLLDYKAHVQRNGRALEEPDIDDEPQEQDYMSVGEPTEGIMTFEQLIEEQVDAPSPIEELVSRAEQITAQTEPSEGAASDMISMPAKPKPSRFWTKFNAWLVARSAWRIKKSNLEYEYERKKTDVENICSGLDYAIDLINKEIERQRNGQSVKIEEPKQDILQQ